MSRPDPNADEARLAVGTVIGGRYRIERVVGAGGMGFVYAARHEQLGELVAVKTLHLKQLGEPEAIERFLREAKACAKIKNDHVVRVLDVSTGEAGKAPYIVMEFLEGQDLGSLVASPMLVSVTSAVDYVLQACEAFAEAHARGIIHRDIKPSNLLLCKRSDGSPLIKVVDFGISKALVPEGDSTNLTSTREVFGSPAYMSPEQVRSAKRVDTRSDVWSIGVLLFELLTKNLPFEGETSAGILAAISADAPRSIRGFRADVPEALEAVVLACLRKNRDERMQSVADLAIALRPFASLEGHRSVEVIAKQNASTSGMSVPPPDVPSAELAYGATERGLSTTTRPMRPSRAFYLGAGGVVMLGLVVAGGAVFVRPHFTSSNVGITSPSHAPLQTTIAIDSATSTVAPVTSATAAIISQSTATSSGASAAASGSAAGSASASAFLSGTARGPSLRQNHAAHVGAATVNAPSSSGASTQTSSPSPPPASSAPSPSNAPDLDLNRRY